MLGLGALGVEGEHLDPAVAERAGARRRVRGTRANVLARRSTPVSADRGGDRAARRAAAAGRSGGWCRSATTRRGLPSAVRERRAGSRGCRAPRRRGSRRSTGRGSPTTVRSRPSPASARSSATWPGSVSWYSSTKTWREPGAQLVAVGLGLDHRAADQVGVVDRALVVEDVEVLLEEQPGRDELRARSRVAPSATQRRAVEALLAGPGQHRLHLARRSRGCRRAARSASGQRTDSGLSVEQLAEHDVLLGRREQPQRRGVQLGGGVAADQAVGEGVERRAQRGRHRAAEPGGDPVAQLLGGLAAEGQRQHRRRVEAPRCSMRSTIASTSVVVLPVPGPASTSSGPPGWSTTDCWCSSSDRGRHRGGPVDGRAGTSSRLHHITGGRQNRSARQGAGRPAATSPAAGSAAGARGRS